MGKLSGKVALVTGGASGIGRAIVGALAAEGADIGIVDRNAAGARRTARVPWIPIAIISAIVIMALFAPLLAPYSPIDQTLRDKLLPPAWLAGGSDKYFLGTDAFGRDILSRLIYGARVSLMVAVLALTAGGGVGLAIGIVAGYLGGAVDGVLMRLVDAAFTFRNYIYIWNSEETQRAIVNTVIVSGGGALVGVVLGIACSYFTVRLRPTGYRVLDALVMLPFGVPGIVLGLGLLWAYAYLPLPLYGTLTLIVLAYVTRFLPYATETSGARFVQLDRSLEEAAWTAGASRISGVWRILMPLSLPSLQSSYFLLFMAFFREISATILIFTASTSVLSVSIWSSFEQANWGLASALSILAMILMVAMMSLLLWVMPGARRR